MSHGEIKTLLDLVDNNSDDCQLVEAVIDTSFTECSKEY
ncbi:hypothetical protein [Providencia vermicola]